MRKRERKTRSKSESLKIREEKVKEQISSFLGVSLIQLFRLSFRVFEKTFKCTFEKETTDDSDDDDGYGGYNVYGERDRGYYYRDGGYERKSSPMMSPIISPVTAQENYAKRLQLGQIVFLHNIEGLLFRRRGGLYIIRSTELNFVM